MRWVLWLKWNTPGYMVQNEMRGCSDWEKTIIRAYNYEKKIEEMGDERWVKQSLKWRKGNTPEMLGGKWRQGKQKALAVLGLTETEIGRLETLSYNVRFEMVKRISDNNMKRREEKIRDSKFNPGFQSICSREGKVKYLQNQNLTIKENMTLAGFRLECVARAAEYWRGVEDKRCRLCGRCEETDPSITV